MNGCSPSTPRSPTPASIKSSRSYQTVGSPISPPGCLSPGVSLRWIKRPLRKWQPPTQGLAPTSRNCSPPVAVPDTSDGGEDSGEKPGWSLLLRYDGACGTVADFEIAEGLSRIAGGNHPHGTWPGSLPLLLPGRERGVPFSPSLAIHPEQLHLASASVDKYHLEGVTVRPGDGSRGAFRQGLPPERG